MKFKQIKNDIMEAMQATKPKTSPYDTEAEVIRVEGSTAWVHIPGGVTETPVSLTIAAQPGDMVRVRVSGGSAWLVGNDTAPPTDDTTAVAAQEEAAEAGTIARSAQKAAVSAERIAGNTAQHFWVTSAGTDTGAHITEVTQEEFLADPANGGGNLLARTNGIAVRDGLTEVSAFGAGWARIGEASYTHIDMNYNSLAIKDMGGYVFFKVQDLRDDSGYAELTETYTATSGQTVFETSWFIADNTTPTATVNGSEVSCSRTGNQKVTFGTACTAGDEVAITYQSDAINLKTYTLGIRRGAEGPMSVAEGNRITASGNCSHAEGFETMSSSMATHAEGLKTTASGAYSHAEGGNTVANEAAAHAEGFETTASGQFSHAEGLGTVAGYACHAEGYETTAGGNGAHAEGRITAANGLASHAEGYRTTANGAESHAQNLGTTAGQLAQTAIGKYNDNKTDTALEIGNGASDAHGNALDVTWDGEVRLALDTTAAAGTTDGDLYAAITAAGWASEVIE